MYFSDQAIVMSNCPLGSPEAEEIYQEARKYSRGQEGYPYDSEKAEALFEKAMFMGNSKAPLGIAYIYSWDYSDKYKAANRYKYMIYLYNEAIKMGCAEGHIKLAECYDNGWGVHRDVNKVIEELKKGVDKNSPKAFEFYGTYLIETEKRVEKGREYLRKSMEMGNGDAGHPLASSYLGEDDDRFYAALRAGAKLGSKACLSRLATLYLGGHTAKKKMMESIIA